MFVPGKESLDSVSLELIKLTIWQVHQILNADELASIQNVFVVIMMLAPGANIVKFVFFVTYEWTK